MRNKVPGKISDVHFKNVSLTGEEKEGKYRIWVTGADPEHRVTDISFENMSWYNQLLDENSPQVKIGDYTSNIRFIHSEARK